MELDDLHISDKPKSCVIIHPVTNKKTDLVIYCVSPDNAGYKGKMLESLREGLNSEGKPDLAKFEDHKKASIAALVTGWDNATIGGKKFEYSEKNVIALFTKFPFIFEQVDKFCGERANFFEKKKTA